MRPMMVNNRGPIVMTVLGPMLRPAVPIVIAAMMTTVPPVILGRAMVSTPAPSMMPPIPMPVRPGAARHQNKYRTHRKEPL